MTALVLDKVAWVHVVDRRLLVTRNRGRHLFYLPGGHREPGESDTETLVREIDEELNAAIDPASMRRFGEYEELRSAGVARMTCYRAGHKGPLTVGREIAELAWFSHAERHRTSPLDQQAIDQLRAADLID
jgi:8-oxo-dGTP pyrophosphatase MutT (NUDIX family)